MNLAARAHPNRWGQPDVAMIVMHIGRAAVIENPTVRALEPKSYIGCRYSTHICRSDYVRDN
jgi:hypothetical protein